MSAFIDMYYLGSLKFNLSEKKQKECFFKAKYVIFGNNGEIHTSSIVSYQLEDVEATKLPGQKHSTSFRLVEERWHRDDGILDSLVSKSLRISTRLFQNHAQQLLWAVHCLPVM